MSQQPAQMSQQPAPSPQTQNRPSLPFSKPLDYFSLTLFCSKDSHNTRPAHLFCMNSECGALPVCEECFLKAHKDHVCDLKYVPDFLNEVKNDVLRFNNRNTLLKNSSGLTQLENIEFITKRFAYIKTSVLMKIEELEADITNCALGYLINKFQPKYKLLESSVATLERYLDDIGSENPELINKGFTSLFEIVQKDTTMDGNLDSLVRQSEQAMENIQKLVDGVQNNIHRTIELALGQQNTLFCTGNSFTMLPKTLSEMMVDCSPAKGRKSFGNFNSFTTPEKEEYQHSQMSLESIIQHSGHASQRSSLMNQTQIYPEEVKNTIIPGSLLTFENDKGTIVNQALLESDDGHWTHYFSKDPLTTCAKILVEIERMNSLKDIYMLPQILIGVSEEKGFGPNGFVGSTNKSWSFGCTGTPICEEISHKCMTSGRHEQSCGKHHDAVFHKYGTAFQAKSRVEMIVRMVNGKKSLSYKVDGGDYGVCFDILPEKLYLAVSMVSGTKVSIKRIECGF